MAKREMTLKSDKYGAGLEPIVASQKELGRDPASRERVDKMRAEIERNIRQGRSKARRQRSGVARRDD